MTTYPAEWRRGDYQLGVGASPALRLDAAFAELAQAI
jgi:hypothetical protein